MAEADKPAVEPVDIRQYSDDEYQDFVASCPYAAHHGQYVRIARDCVKNGKIIGWWRIVAAYGLTQDRAKRAQRVIKILFRRQGVV
jgi:hypothetical protein